MRCLFATSSFRACLQVALIVIVIVVSAGIGIYVGMIR
jgi:hypothetical protein